jgi:Na+-driven multidrug efflux pump
MRPMLRVGRQIFVRTTALYGSFLVAASVLARMGDAQLGAHQIAFQLYIFLALLLDAVAIAGQVIVGRMLGSGDAAGAFDAAVRMIALSTLVGLAFAVVLAPLSHVLIGASDTRYLMWSMLAASALFVAIAALALADGWGIVGVWAGLDVLLGARLALLGGRFARRRWAVVGWS